MRAFERGSGGGLKAAEKSLFKQTEGGKSEILLFIVCLDQGLLEAYLEFGLERLILMEFSA